MRVQTYIQLAALPFFSATLLFSIGCATKPTAQKDTSSVLTISVPAQKLVLYKEGKVVKTYPISTSKFGLGNEKGSYRTPLGRMEVAEKIGGGKPAGAVFKSREWTGEVIKPDSPGRDPIVSRILWLRGTEKKNANTYSRCIYIHGTAAEKDIGKAVSYGCVRMKSRDVIDLYRKVGEGATVYITKKDLSDEAEEVTVSPGNTEGIEIEALPLKPSIPNGTDASTAPNPPAAELNHPTTQFQPGAPARTRPPEPECEDPHADPDTIPNRISPDSPVVAPMRREFRTFPPISS